MQMLDAMKANGLRIGKMDLREEEKLGKPWD
jgi:hypothetical protein